MRRPKYTWQPTGIKSIFDGGITGLNPPALWPMGTWKYEDGQVFVRVERRFVWAWHQDSPIPNGCAVSRCLCAVRSLTELERITGYSARQLRRFGAETELDEDVKVAMQEPGKVFCRPTNRPEAPYIKVDNFKPPTL